MNCVNHPIYTKGIFPFVIEPYQNCYYNFRDGLLGKRVNMAAATAMTNGQNTSVVISTRSLNVQQRLKCIVVSILLAIPIINVLVLGILKRMNSEYYYSKSNTVGIGDLEDPRIIVTMSVNQRNLSRIPTPFNLDEMLLELNQAHPPLALAEVLTHFDRLFSGIDPNEVLYIDPQLSGPGTPVRLAKAREDIENNYIDFARRNLNSDDRHSRMVAQEIDVFLKAIALSFRNEQLSVDKKREALKDLASAAAGHCRPRRHTAAKEIYLKLVNRIETLEQIILQANQMAKEALFKAHYSLSREPVQTLNFIRQEVGAALGLDRSEVNLNDEYIRLADARAPENRFSRHTTEEEFIEVFKRIYTPGTVIPLVRNYLNERIAADNEFARNISAFISQEINNHRTQGHLTDREVDALPQPYQRDYDHSSAPFHLTDLGVKFLLVHFDLLNEATPNGHLVRMPAPTQANTSTPHMATGRPIRTSMPNPNTQQIAVH